MFYRTRGKVYTRSIAEFVKGYREGMAESTLRSRMAQQGEEEEPPPPPPPRNQDRLAALISSSLEHLPEESLKSSRVPHRIDRGYRPSPVQRPPERALHPLRAVVLLKDVDDPEVQHDVPRGVPRGARVGQPRPRPRAAAAAAAVLFDATLRARLVLVLVLFRDGSGRASKRRRHRDGDGVHAETNFFLSRGERDVVAAAERAGDRARVRRPRRRGREDVVQVPERAASLAAAAEGGGEAAKRDAHVAVAVAVVRRRGERTRRLFVVVAPRRAAAAP
eukprot:30017-Pelagococcus_subviridis.AAC.8